MLTIHIIKNKTFAAKVTKTKPDPSFHRYCKRDNPAGPVNWSLGRN